MPTIIAALFLALTIASTPLSPASMDDGRYSDQLYRQAVFDRENTAVPYVLVTIVDGISGQSRHGCTGIAGLAAAVALKRGWNTLDSDARQEKLTNILLETPARRFVFTTPRLLAGAGFYETKRDEEACALLRRGIPAFAADISGQTVAGRPGAPIVPVSLR